MSLVSIRSLVLVGAGKMGGAMLAGWLDRGLAGAAVTIVDPKLGPEMTELTIRHSVRHLTDAGAAPDRPDVIVLAVKPQQMGAALPRLAALVGPETIVVSVAAGTTIATLQAALGSGPIVRVMPNTPAMVGQGMSVAVASPAASEADRALVTALMDAVGKTAWVSEESLIDAVTAVSGSGPAYVFLLAEVLAEAGRAAGLPAELADQIARQTVIGAGALLGGSPLDPATLRKNVTSPGGTTAAALAVLMADGGMQDLMTAAVAAATQRSRELAG